MEKSEIDYMLSKIDKFAKANKFNEACSCVLELKEKLFRDEEKELEEATMTMYNTFNKLITPFIMFGLFILIDLHLYDLWENEFKPFLLTEIEIFESSVKGMENTYNKRIEELNGLFPKF